MENLPPVNRLFADSQALVDEELAPSTGTAHTALPPMSEAVKIFCRDNSLNQIIVNGLQCMGFEMGDKFAGVSAEVTVANGIPISPWTCFCDMYGKYLEENSSM